MHYVQIFASEMHLQILTALTSLRLTPSKLETKLFLSRESVYRAALYERRGGKRGPGCKLRFAEYRKHGNCTSAQPRYPQKCMHSTSERETRMKCKEIYFAYFTPRDVIPRDQP